MKIVAESYLTTKDNPFSYFKNYDEWLAFDEQKGYYTNNLVARLYSELGSSELYSSERVVEQVEMIYFDILQMFPETYELRSE